MNDSVRGAAARLEAVLQAENAALERLDHAAAVALLAEKRLAADILAGVLAELQPDAELEALAIRLQELANRNRALLKRAMAVQRGVIDLVARALRQAQPTRGYTARAVSSPGAAVPLSFATRI